MDFLALQTEVSGRLHGNLSDAPFLALLKTWINLSRKKIVLVNPNADFLETTHIETLVATQSEYDLTATPGDIVKINPEEIRLTDTETKLYHLDSNNSGFIASMTAASTPTHFRLRGYQTIQIFPPPDAAAVTAHSSITLEYTKTFPTDMSANGDLHGLPPHLEPILVDLAETYGQSWLRQDQRAQAAWQRAVVGLQAYAPGSEFMSVLSLNTAPPVNRTVNTTPPMPGQTT